MRIVAVNVYRVDLPGSEARHISGGRVFSGQDSTVVELRTDEARVGWGESCPFGPAYLPAFAEGVRAGIGVVAEALLGADPTNIRRVRQILDAEIRGQEQMKSGIEMACWDLLGKSVGRPLHVLLGGMLNHAPMRQGFIAAENGAEAIRHAILAGRQRGAPHFEVKATGDLAGDVELVELIAAELHPGEILKVDANGGWSVSDAQRVMVAAPDLHVLYEQPCATYEQCRSLRRLSPRPIFLDECVVTLTDLTRAIADGVISGLNLKIARVGGIASACTMRDLCVAQRIPLIVQCVGGSEITGAAIAHLAHTVAPPDLLSIWNPATMITVETARGLRDTADSAHLRAGSGPGLGIEPLPSVLGAPVATYG